MLAADTEMKLLFFFRYCFFSLTGFCQEMKRSFFFLFGHFSVRFIVSFTRIIHINMAYRLNVFFSHFSRNYFLALKKGKRMILKIKITAIFFYQIFLNILY